MAETPVDYDAAIRIAFDTEASAYDRLARQMEAMAVAVRHQLDPAAQLAGRELELMLSPIPFRVLRALATCAPGTAVIALATSEQVMAIQLPVAALETDIIASAGLPEDVLPEIHYFVRTYGLRPGEIADEDSDQEHACWLLQRMFSPLRFRKAAKTLCHLAEHGICPATVGLIGNFCGAWPLILPLAPYWDAAVSPEISRIQ